MVKLNQIQKSTRVFQSTSWLTTNQKTSKGDNSLWKHNYTMSKESNERFLANNGTFAMISDWLQEWFSGTRE